MSINSSLLSERSNNNVLAKDQKTVVATAKGRTINECTKNAEAIEEIPKMLTLVNDLFELLTYNFINHRSLEIRDELKVLMPELNNLTEEAKQIIRKLTC